jgi:hypothetical protein
MMLVALVADVHVHSPRILGGETTRTLNDRGWRVVNALAAAARAAEARGATHFVVAGDLFDTHKPTPQVIAAVAAALAECSAHKVLVKGNHDSASEEDGDHALAPFGHMDGYTVVDRPTAIDDLLLVPFIGARASEWVNAAVDECISVRNEHEVRPQPPAGLCLVLHVGLVDSEFMRAHDWCVGKPDALDVALLVPIADECDIGAVFAGNYHERKTWAMPTAGGSTVDIVQIGALAPTGWDNPGTVGYGGVEFWNSESGWLDAARVEVQGPRFLHRIPKLSGGNDVYVSLKVPREEASSARGALDDAIAANLIVAGKVEIEGGSNVRTLAAVRSAKTGDVVAALDRYFAGTQLDERLRARAKARCIEFLKGGAS